MLDQASYISSLLHNQGKVQFSSEKSLLLSDVDKL